MSNFTVTDTNTRVLDPKRRHAVRPVPALDQEVIMYPTPTSALPLAGTEPLAPDSPGPPDPAGPSGSPIEEPSRLPVARCADGYGTMTGLFFSDNVVDIARAKAMCGLCELKESCLSGALEREEPWGVWGGELLSGGRIVANKRPCGRPPKHPRPEVVYDELGPVGVVA